MNILPRIAIAAFGVTFLGMALVQRHRDLAMHDRLRAESAVQVDALVKAHQELSVANTALEHQAAAYAGLLESHLALQSLHAQSVEWGPLRAPRDCVREVILLDERAWPFDRDGHLAYEIKAHDWCEGERVRCVEDLDQCFDMAFPAHRPERHDPRAGDADSSWIDWPEGFVVQKLRLGQP